MIMIRRIKMNRQIRIINKLSIVKKGRPVFSFYCKKGEFIFVKNYVSANIDHI